MKALKWQSDGHNNPSQNEALKTLGEKERHGNYVNGRPFQKTEQEMEPLRAVMEPLERKMKCKWREKHTFFLRTVLLDGHPSRLTWVPNSTVSVR